MRVEKRAGDGRTVDTSREKPLRECVCTRAHPPEGSGVGGEPREQAVCDVRIDLDTPRVEDVREYRRGSLGICVDEIVGPEPGIGSMVVDDQRAPGAVQTGTQLTEPTGGAAIHGDQ